MVLKVLGSGCKNCKKLAANALAAIEELGIDARVEKIEDFDKIMEYNIMKTPVLVIDEVVKTQGFIPSVEEIKALINS